MNKLSAKKRFNPDKLENRTVCPPENVLIRTKSDGNSVDLLYKSKES